MTVRTQAELLALYADNGSGDISAADLRDLVDTHFASRREQIHCSLFSPTTGANKPSPGEIGVVSYQSFAVGDDLWPHATLPKQSDDTQDIIVNIDWAPVVAETTKTVSWRLQYSVFDGGVVTIDTVAGTLTAIDEVVPALQWQESKTTFTVPAVDFPAGAHEIHMKVSRIASTNDPTDIVIHHVWVDVAVHA